MDGFRIFLRKGLGLVAGYRIREGRLQRARSGNADPLLRRVWRLTGENAETQGDPYDGGYRTPDQATPPHPLSRLRLLRYPADESFRDNDRSSFSKLLVDEQKSRAQTFKPPRAKLASFEMIFGLIWYGLTQGIVVD